MIFWQPQHDWVVHRTRHHRELLTVVLERGPVPAATLLALRSLREEFRQMPAARLKALIGVSGRVELGTLSGREAHKMADRTRDLGLRIERIDRSSTSYLPFDRTTGTVLLIEDDDEAQRVAFEMIAAGTPVEEAECD